MRDIRVTTLAFCASLALCCSVARSFTPAAFVIPVRAAPAAVSTAFVSGSTTALSRDSRFTLASSFFGKFDEDDFEEEKEDDDDEDEDEDDEDYADLDDEAVADFRSKMANMFGEPAPEETSEEEEQEEESSDSSGVDELINFARGKDSSDDGTEESTDWARVTETITAGTVLVANPANFCSDFGNERSMPTASLLAKFGLTLPPPADLGPDRRADLLPVLVLVDTKGAGEGNRAVLLNRRTGYLLGDLEQQPGQGSAPPTPMLEKFCIQPLWFGGVDNMSAGLDMLHLCPAVQDATPLTKDGLYWGGDPAEAQEAMSDASLDRVFSGFDFKFFVQSTVWRPGELEKQIRAGTWVTASVSKEVLFKSRDRMGTQRAKPLWTEIMELLGGDYAITRDKLYEEDGMQ